MGQQPGDHTPVGTAGPFSRQEHPLSMKFVLVAGATGYLGKHVVHALKQQGHRVRALVRNREKLWKRGPFLEPAVGPEVDEIVVGDLTRPETLRGICRDIEYVISCAGLSQKNSRENFLMVDYQGHSHLLREAQQSPELKKFIYIALPQQSRDPRHDLIVAKERFVRELQESPTTSCIIRPTPFYSAMTGYLNMARQGTVYVFERGEPQMNPVHGADLAQVCIKAMIAKEKELTVGGPDVFTQQQMARLAFEALGKAPRIRVVSPGVARLLGGWLHLFKPDQARTLAAMSEVILRGCQAPAQGRQHLGDYFKEFVASPFFRES